MTRPPTRKTPTAFSGTWRITETELWDAEALGPLHYRIPRVIAGQIVVDPSRTTGFRAVPAVDNGQAVGFTLYAIRAGSLYEQLGFENGDVIKNVNGMPLTSADAAAAAHAKVSSASQVTFEIDRRARAIVLTIDVQ